MESICSKLKPYLKGDFASGMDDVIEQLAEQSLDLQEDLRSAVGPDQKTGLYRQYLEKAALLSSHVSLKLNDFAHGLEWMNVTEPLSLHRDLKGKLVLLDFFTYCCINCMHILPDLKKLEQEFSVEDGLVVVGVHNAKFTNEKVTANIESAVRRYGITHPVVNDSLEGMWTTLGIGCWPTLYLLGPQGEPLASLQGEGHYETLRGLVGEALKFYSGRDQISPSPLLQLSSFRPPIRKTLLSYPGKVTLSKDSSLLAVSDTSNHRILVASIQGEVLHEIGGLDAGFADGDFSSAKFDSPQGLAFYDDNTLYVADTENHSIRQISLREGRVVTVVGTGKQGSDYSGGGPGPSQPVSSPWDVCPVGDVLFIAMAGLHQLWAYFIKDSTVFGTSHKAGTCRSVVGSGREENRNSTYPRSVGLAQPSALAHCPQRGRLYLADSESSAVRGVELASGATSLLAGGDINPKNLFAYGDVDGVGVAAKLQHPLGVACHTSGVFVADSYNHKIKLIDPATKSCTTISLPDNQLNEPGGVFISGDKLYIADTNNHCIKVMSIPDYSLSTIDIRPKASVKKPPAKCLETYKVNMNKDNTLKLSLEIVLPGKSANDLSSPSVWTMFYPGNKLHSQVESPGLRYEWSLGGPGSPITREATSAPRRGVVTARLFLCAGTACSVREYSFGFEVITGASGDSDSHTSIRHQDDRPF